MTVDRTPSAAGHADPQPRMAFFTDTTVCIGCKACEVACKEWNDIPAGPLELSGFSYDNTVGLGADSWRAVRFIEQRIPQIRRDGEAGLLTDGPTDAGPDVTAVGTGGFDGSDTEALDITRAGPDGRALAVATSDRTELRWLMSSDVCKHCTTAACLDVCPTGALFATEFSTIVVQPDVCNGCGYCIPACPYGVVDQRPDDGRAWKCTMCYDRLKGGMEPACAQACPTDSILFGTHQEMRQAAGERLAEVVEAGYVGAQLYGADEDNGVDGCGAFFLLLDDPEVYGLPPDPVAATRDVASTWGAAAAAALALAGVVVTVVRGRG